jgi:pyruvate kinase
VEEAIAMSAMYAANHLKGVTDHHHDRIRSDRADDFAHQLRPADFRLSRHERTLNLTALYRGVTPVHFDSVNDGVAAAHDAVICCG